MGGEVNCRMGRRRRGEGSWNVRGCGKSENRGEAGMVGKMGWGTRERGNGLKRKETPRRRKLTQRSESFRRWVAEKWSRARKAEGECYDGTEKGGERQKKLRGGGTKHRNMERDETGVFK